MAVTSASTINGFTRDASWFNPAADWTVEGWVYLPSLAANKFATIWTYGDSLAVSSYIWLGVTSQVTGTQQLDLELWNGSVVFDLNMNYTPNTWAYVIAQYNSTTHTATLRLNQVDAGSLVSDLSAYTFPIVTEYILTDTGASGNAVGGVAISYWGEWNTLISNDLSYDQSRFTQPEIAAGNALAYTPLTSISDLTDISGNARNWVAVGTVTTFAGPRLAIFTDQFIMTQIQNTMIEPDDGGQTWPSQLWTTAEVVSYLNQRQNRFLKNTHFQFGIANITTAIGTETYDLPDDWINTIRVLWLNADGTNKEITRSDLWEADNGIPTWSYVNGTPLIFSDGGKPITLRLAPIPDAISTLIVHYVPIAALLTGNGELMTIPDEFVVPLKYGAMADMLTKVSRVQDVRAQYCEQRYMLGVEVAKLLLKGFK